MSDDALLLASTEKNIALQAEIERLRALVQQHGDEAWIGMERKNDVIEECARLAYECATGIEACRKIRALKEKP